MDHETTTHDRLQAALKLAGLELSASETHGMLCGEICRCLRPGRGTDIAELLGVAEPGQEHRDAAPAAVEEVMAESHRALDAGMQFALLLPGDDRPIDERTGAMADWARGFVVALLRGNDLTLENLDGDSAEVVRDLLKISEAAPGENPEEDERALVELEEYVRVGVQLVFEELQPDEHNDSHKGVH